ncbi:hypothetical protein DM860_011196 [Cuscuta australis]|uniref:Ubiquitin-like protease family profile domain-containing protein n=1 Tax=Cuscuta australis TaxID=267555 RepID=A0A328DS39_9ASTE|nr:hypothetical protein DM860_011196 [Cuscuta australis]
MPQGMWIWDEIVFKCGNVVLDRGDLMTLNAGEHISPRVIDAWSTILNHKEVYRSIGSPSRFFAKGMKCLYTSEGDIPDEDTAFKLFCDALESGNTCTSPFSADMIFFPIMQLKWCYCVCVNIKAMKVELLDLSSSSAKADDKYEGMPTNVLDMLVKYFSNQGLEGKVGKVCSQKPTRLKMSWRDVTSVYEYGVATMRHMETYMGRGLEGWDFGLSKEDRKAVNTLRSKYCACISVAEVNEMKEVNLKNSKDFMKG